MHVLEDRKSKSPLSCHVQPLSGSETRPPLSVREYGPIPLCTTGRKLHLTASDGKFLRIELCERMKIIQWLYLTDCFSFSNKLICRESTERTRVSPWHQLLGI